MSRALAVAERLPMDAYQTPEPLALAICRQLAQRLSPEEIIEPSAGSGSFVRAARTTWPEAHVTANELDRGRRRELLQAGAHQVLHLDWPRLAGQIAFGQAEHGKGRLVVGNPPFGHAVEHVEAGLKVLRAGDELAFLLRLSLLGSLSRVPFWRKNRPVLVVPVVPRPSFTGGGTDATEYALFIWGGHSERRGRNTRLAAPLIWRGE